MGHSALHSSVVVELSMHCCTSIKIVMANTNPVFRYFFLEQSCSALERHLLLSDVLNSSMNVRSSKMNVQTTAQIPLVSRESTAAQVADFVNSVCVDFVCGAA